MEPNTIGRSTIEEELEKNGVFLHTIVGDSMRPYLRNRRDIVEIKPVSGRLKKYDVPLYKRDSGQYVLHRVLKVRKQDYVICGDNRHHKEYGITDGHVIGIMTGFYRDNVYYSVNNRLYKCYVHFICDFFILRKIVLWLRDKWWQRKRKVKEKT